jgi:hypothetical protein
MYDYDIARNALECDELVREFWGIENDDLVSCAVFMDRVHAEDRELLQSTIDRAINSHTGGEYRVMVGSQESGHWPEGNPVLVWRTNLHTMIPAIRAQHANECPACAYHSYSTDANGSWVAFRRTS